MSRESNGARRSPVGTIVTFIIAILLYAVMLASLGDARGSDAAGRGMALAFGAMFGVALWIALAVLLLIAFAAGRMPRWAGAGMVILLPLAAFASLEATELYTARGGWPLLVPAVLPPLFALYAVAMRIPALAVPETPFSIVVVVAGLLVSAAPLTIAFLRSHPSQAQQAKARAEVQAQQAARERQEREAREQELAAFRRLDANSSLRDYLTYLAPGDARYREAMAGARMVRSRQSDATALLRQGRIGDLQDLHRLDLAPTADLCAAYDVGLRIEAMKVERGRGAYLSAAMDLERQLPNIKWLTDAGCDLDPSLTLLEANVRAVSDSERLNRFADTLRARRKAP